MKLFCQTIGAAAISALLLTGCDTIRINTDDQVITTEPAPDYQHQPFSEAEAMVLRQHYGGKSKAQKLPPGLQKKAARGGQLPPGWQKKIARGEVLDDDLYRRGQPVSRDVRIHLPHEHGDVQTIIIEGKAVRIIRATREIIDALDLDK